MPAPNHKSPLVTCPECGDLFELTDPRKVFCCNEHKRAWNNRMLGRGGALMLLMQAWRQGRHKKGDGAAKYAFTELCIAIDEASAEDRAAGRPPALEVLRNRYRRQGLGGIEAAAPKGKASRAVGSDPNRESVPAL
jgi:hypothetical protein